MKWSLQELHRGNKIAAMSGFNFKYKMKNIHKIIGAVTRSTWHWLLNGYHPYYWYQASDIIIYEIRDRLIQFKNNYKYHMGYSTILIEDVFGDSHHNLKEEDEQKLEDRMHEILDKLIYLASVLLEEVDGIDYQKNLYITYHNEFYNLLKKYVSIFWD